MCRSGGSQNGNWRVHRRATIELHARKHPLPSVNRLTNAHIYIYVHTSIYNTCIRRYEPLRYDVTFSRARASLCESVRYVYGTLSCIACAHNHQQQQQRFVHRTHGPTQWPKSKPPIGKIPAIEIQIISNIIVAIAFVPLSSANALLTITQFRSRLAQSIKEFTQFVASAFSFLLVT